MQEISISTASDAAVSVLVSFIFCVIICFRIPKLANLSQKSFFEREMNITVGGIIITIFVDVVAGASENSFIH